MQTTETTPQRTTVKPKPLKRPRPGGKQMPKPMPFPPAKKGAPMPCPPKKAGKK